jgi:hypothetical protein
MKDQDNGVRYLIHKIGTPQFRNVGGVLAPSGEWWDNSDGWVGRHSADIFPSDAPDTLNLPLEGEWVAVFLNVSVNGEVG